MSFHIPVAPSLVTRSLLYRIWQIVGEMLIQVNMYKGGCVHHYGILLSFIQGMNTGGTWYWIDLGHGDFIIHICMKTKHQQGITKTFWRKWSWVVTLMGWHLKGRTEGSEKFLGIGGSTYRSHGVAREHPSTRAQRQETDNSWGISVWNKPMSDSIRPQLSVTEPGRRLAHVQWPDLYFTLLVLVS